MTRDTLLADAYGVFLLLLLVLFALGDVLVHVQHHRKLHGVIYLLGGHVVGRVVRDETL